MKRPTRGPELLQKSYLFMNIFRKKLFDHENEEPGPLRKKKKLPKWALLAESNCNWMKVVIACCVANPSFFLFHIWNLHSEKGGGGGSHPLSPPTLCPNLPPPPHPGLRWKMPAPFLLQFLLCKKFSMEHVEHAEPEFFSRRNKFIPKIKTPAKVFGI